MSKDYQTIINFWFTEIDEKQWFVKDPKFDSLLRQRFLTLHKQAAACELFAWRKSALGRLAEIIILDQFSRNMFRDTPQAFAYDGMALTLAQEAVAINADQELPLQQRNFIYMAYMHSESKLVHEVAQDLFQNHSDANTLDFELRHKRIIDQFGRYPHRNEILGRESSQAELEFLTQANSGF